MGAKGRQRLGPTLERRELVGEGARMMAECDPLEARARRAQWVERISAGAEEPA